METKLGQTLRSPPEGRAEGARLRNGARQAGLLSSDDEDDIITGYLLSEATRPQNPILKALTAVAEAEPGPSKPQQRRPRTPPQENVPRTPERHKGAAPPSPTKERPSKRRRTAEIDRLAGNEPDNGSRVQRWVQNVNAIQRFDSIPEIKIASTEPATPTESSSDTTSDSDSDSDSSSTDSSADERIATQLHTLRRSGLLRILQAYLFINADSALEMLLIQQIIKVLRTRDGDEQDQAIAWLTTVLALHEEEDRVHALMMVMAYLAIEDDESEEDEESEDEDEEPERKRRRR